MIQIIKLAQGNPGALTFLMLLIDDSNLIHAIPIVDKVSKCNIVGTALYILWSDLCNKDMTIVEKLCTNCPNDVLIDACSRQDYSGRELVKEYL